MSNDTRRTPYVGPTMRALAEQHDKAERDRLPKIRFDAFAIVEQDRGKSYFHRAGSAWVNKDGSIAVTLELIPLAVLSSGELKLQLREPEPRADDREGRQ